MNKAITELKSPAIAIAKKNARPKEQDEIVTLSTGVRAIIKPVSASLIEEASSSVKDPPIPVYYDENKGRNELNPLDPEYNKQLEEAAKLRGFAALDTMILFGLILIDEIPPLEEWLPRLQFLQKRGRISLAGYDMDDMLDREFVYKKYIAIAAQDLTMLSDFTSAVRRAEDSFPSDKEGNSNT